MTSSNLGLVKVDTWGLVRVILGVDEELKVVDFGLIRCCASSDRIGTFLSKHDTLTIGEAEDRKSKDCSKPLDVPSTIVKPEIFFCFVRSQQFDYEIQMFWLPSSRKSKHVTGSSVDIDFTTLLRSR